MSKGWRSLPISDVCKLFTDGNWIETKDQSHGGIRLIQTGNVGIGDFKDRQSKARYISEDTFLRLKCQEVFDGDCLVSRLPDPVGRSCIVPETGDRMITAVDCTIMRFNQSVIIPDFFNYYSQSNKYLRDVDSYCTGATRKRISRKNLGKVALPLPPLPEQKRIVTILDEAFAGIDTAIANTKKNLANAQELFDSYLKFSLIDNEKKWPSKKLAEISENLDSKRVPITKSKRESGNIPYYGASGIVDYVADFIFDEDLLLVSEDGANLLARTYPIAFSIAGKTWVNNHAHVLRFDNIESQKFVEYYLNSISLVPYVSGMAQPKLNQKSLNSIPLPFPSLEIQGQMVSLLDDLNESKKRLMSIQEQRLAALAELKQSLLNKAFSGQLITETEKEIEEAVA